MRISDWSSDVCSSDLLAPTPVERKTAIFEHGDRFSAVLTRGPLGLTAEEIAALPNLQIICVIGAGYEQVDLQAARNRGIRSEERRVGKECVSTCRSRWTRYH